MELDQVHWFAHLGQPLLEPELAAAEQYLAALGAGEVSIGLVPDWAAAAECAESPGFNTTWWEAEEMLRASLTAEALEVVDKAEFTLAMTRLGEKASQAATAPAEEAAALAGVSDMDLVRAAMGSVVQACHLRGLADMGGAGSDHPFIHKFALLEAGRWPIAVIGETFHLF